MEIFAERINGGWLLVSVIMKRYLEKWFDDEWEDRPNVTKEEIKAEITEVLNVSADKSVEYYTFTY